MRVLSNWRDLEDFGIDMLTGEACGLSMRLLCDVTERGKVLIERFFGGTITVKPGSNWNGGNKADPHVGSILLPSGVFSDLAAFCLIIDAGAGENVATCEDGRAMSWTWEELEHRTTQELRESWEKTYGVKRYYRRSTGPGTGDRNTHAFSGRTE